jgi:hypothetical protein
MHARRFISLPYAHSDRIREVLSLCFYASIQGLVQGLVWGWERDAPVLGLLAWVGYTPLLFLFDFTQLSIDAMVPSYKRGEEDIFALFWSLHLKLGFWVAIPFDTTVFTRPESLGSDSFYLFGENIARWGEGGVNDCARSMHFLSC